VNLNGDSDTLSSFRKELSFWTDDFHVKSEEMHRNGCVRVKFLTKMDRIVMQEVKPAIIIKRNIKFFNWTV